MSDQMKHRIMYALGFLCGLLIGPVNWGSGR